MNDKLDQAWIRGQVFYNKISWDFLIANAIEPFLCHEKDNIKTFYLQFCNEPITNIKITIKPSIDGEKMNLENRFLDYMDEFLLNNPSESQNLGYRFYPNNSAWVDQFDDDVFYVKNDVYVNLDVMRNEISRAMIIFKEHEINNESIYTFVLYMQLAIIRAIFPSADKVKVGIDDIIEFLKSDKYVESVSKKFDLLQNRVVRIKKPNDLSAKNNEKMLNQMFRHNADILSEIIEEVWSVNEVSDLIWLNDWVTCCAESYNSLHFGEFFVIASRLIYEHVGLENKKLLPLSTKLIMNAFNQIAVSN